MNGPQCLYCYQLIEPGKGDYHVRCAKKIFENSQVPVFPYTETQMLELAEQIIKSQATVTGVQPKLSLGIESNKDNKETDRLTIVGLWGNFILKPPTKLYPHLPEVEDLSMHLAGMSGIITVPHALIRMQEGKLAYITRRIDRKKKQKYAMEDMCQLTERLTEHKYQGSYEQIGKAIVKYATNPGLDIINLFEQIVFCYLIGNNDMHLKNFSLFKDPIQNYILSPAYDLVASSLLLPEDKEELALTLNGKKKKIKQADFKIAINNFNIDQKVLQNIFSKFAKLLPKWNDFIEISFLPEPLKEEYKKLIVARAKKLELI